MRIPVENFQGMMTRPDPAEVGSRFSRNIVFGPAGTWIESRPGTEHLTWMEQPETSVPPAVPEPPPPDPPPILGSELLLNPELTEGTYSGPSGGWMEVDGGDTNISNWAVIGPATQTGVNPVQIDWSISSTGWIDLAGSPGWGGISQVVSLADATDYQIRVDAKRQNGGNAAEVRSFRVDVRAGTDPDGGASLENETFVAVNGISGRAGATTYTLDFTTATSGNHVVSVRYAPSSASDDDVYGALVYLVSVKEVIDPDPPPPTPPSPVTDQTYSGVYRLKDDRVSDICVVMATHDEFDNEHGPRAVFPVVFMSLAVVGFGSDLPSEEADYEVAYIQDLADFLDYVDEISDESDVVVSGGTSPLSQAIAWATSAEGIGFFIIRNTGSDPLTVTGVSFDPATSTVDGFDFIWFAQERDENGDEQLWDPPYVIAPGGELYIAVGFGGFTGTPNSPGPFSVNGEVTIETDGGNFIQNLTTEFIDV